MLNILNPLKSSRKWSVAERGRNGVNGYLHVKLGNGGSARRVPIYINWISIYPAILLKSCLLACLLSRFTAHNFGLGLFSS